MVELEKQLKIICDYLQERTSVILDEISLCTRLLENANGRDGSIFDYYQKKKISLTGEYNRIHGILKVLIKDDDSIVISL